MSSSQQPFQEQQQPLPPTPDVADGPADVPVAPPKPSGQSLPDFLSSLEDFTPTIPDSVTTHYLHSAGFESSDPRVVRLISLAAQKFVSDVVNDALYHNKIRTSGASGGPSGGTGTSAGGSGTGSSAAGKKVVKDKKLTLTMEDLTPALAEYGINAKKPHYFN